MNNSLTLNQFFSPEKIISPKGMSVLESGADMLSLKERLARESRIKWPVALDTIAGKIRDILNLDILNIMVAAWKKQEKIRQFGDKEKYPADETFLVPLAEHTISSEHHPYIEVKVNNVPLARIEFRIDISLKLEGLVLNIQDGKLKKLFTGNCEGKGTVKYREQVILERTTGAIPFPGAIDFGEGVPVAF
jgi:hypothetical protein